MSTLKILRGEDKVMDSTHILKYESVVVFLRTEFRKEAMKTEPSPLHNYHHGFSSPAPYVFVVVVKAVLCHMGIASCILWLH